MSDKLYYTLKIYIYIYIITKNLLNIMNYIQYFKTLIVGTYNIYYAGGDDVIVYDKFISKYF